MGSMLLAAAFDFSAALDFVGNASTIKVGRLPAMGYDTWNAYACDYNASVVLTQAKAMNESGLVAAGYNILILDDCYALKQRNATGYMVPDPAMFPEGMPAFSKQVNALGIHLAAYGDSGYETCAGHPGSYGREEMDLLTWQEWGMSYLKYDNCCKYCHSVQVLKADYFQTYLPTT